VISDDIGRRREASLVSKPGLYNLSKHSPAAGIVNVPSCGSTRGGRQKASRIPSPGAERRWLKHELGRHPSLRTRTADPVPTGVGRLKRCSVEMSDAEARSGTIVQGW
jgi:hypothetical protein